MACVSGDMCCVCICVFCWKRQCYWCWFFWGEVKEINTQTRSFSFALASEKYFSWRLIKIHIHRMQIDKGAAFWLSCLILQPSQVLKTASWPQGSWCLCALDWGSGCAKQTLLDSDLLWAVNWVGWGKWLLSLSFWCLMTPWAVGEVRLFSTLKPRSWALSHAIELF